MARRADDGRDEVQQDATASYHTPSPQFTYYVQSPSSESRTLPDPASTFHFSPTRPDTDPLVSHYYQDHKEMRKIGMNRLVIIDRTEGEGEKGDFDVEDEEDDYEWIYGEGRKKKKRGCWWRYFSFRSSDSCSWVFLQMGWRLLLSLSVALFVFYLATEPPSPKISLRMGGGSQFVLGEGVDSHGVTTKILSCNYSIKLMVDNKSKVFGLHIHPPSMQISFRRISLAVSHGPKLYAESRGSTLFYLHVGTKNKPMYGAGRDMQDMLESSHGLNLTVRISLVSHFRVVWDLIRPKFRHNAECSLLLVLDKKRQIVNKGVRQCKLVY